MLRPANPLRLISSKSLPKELRNSLLNATSSTMNLIEDAPDIEVSQNTIVGNDFIDRSFEHGLKNAKRTV